MAKTRGTQSSSFTCQPDGETESAGRPKVALVADDEPLVRQLVSSILRRHGWHTIVATNGIDALGRSLDEAIDLLVTDYQMPTITGLELAAFVRQRVPELPVLVISGLPGISVDAEKRGYSFLMKPFAFEELAALVDTLTTQQAHNRGPTVQAAQDALSRSSARSP